MTKFQKPSLGIEEEISLLRNRGLLIPDPDKARHYLQYIGYYRLSGYMRPFQSLPDHTFKPGTDFDKILDLYIFDRKLRLHLLDALERIEISLRAVLNDALSVQLGTHWYLEKNAFRKSVDHPELLERLREEMGYKSRRKRETFIAHYLDIYTDPTDPPGWMMIQTLSLGSVSRLYEELNTPYQKAIASKFDLDHIILISALHALSYLRNLCAHHSRVWNREFRIKPKIPRHKASTFTGPIDRLSAMIVIIDLLLACIAPESIWKDSLNKLLDEHPNVHKKSMGL